MGALYSTSVFVHVVAACAWIGSMVFFAAVVVPVLRRPEHSVSFAPLLRSLGARYRVLGWTCIAVLAATGLSNLALRGLGLDALSSGALWASGFGHALALKLALVALVVLATGTHDVLFGARAMQRVSTDPRSPAAVRARRVASWLGRLTLLLSLLVVLAAVWLVRGSPW